MRFLQGQERLDRFGDFLRTPASALGRSVWLGAEGSSQDRALGFDIAADRMVRRASPRQ